jgi:tetratricopeptide (TPR) repeat protein
LDGSVFPPDIAPTRFQWEDGTARVDRWRVRVDFQGGGAPMQFASAAPEWTPSAEAWEEIKQRSVEAAATVTMCGVDRRRPEEVLSQDRVTIRTSRDEVGAPIFYREVNLPFGEAVKDPGAHIRWRFGSISTSEQPPIVLEKLLVCGNCHSFSADGSVLGMDVDYANDKGSYAICRVNEEISLREDNIITWSDYRRGDGKKTFGLLSQVSPDGRHVVSTVKDLSVFEAVDDLTFSQLFFPIRGILCVYDRETETYRSLPGADDDRYVQSNPTWSPDGNYIVFARCEAYHAQEARANELGLTRAEEISKFLSERNPFRFDLYRVPFNGGRGGKAEPLAGASHNGRSNYFARYSPDGRWIVFCQANSFMLLQPDSELYIIPAEGGAARRLECNTRRMNSWHSWSPNSRWLVFSSKAFTPYTQLFLAHVDERGHASPPVVLSWFTAPDMAANIPEFVRTSPDAIKIIRNEFIEDLYHVRAADKYALAGQYDLATAEFEKAVAIDPDRAGTHRLWGVMLLSQGKFPEAEQRIRNALEIDPDDRRAYWNLANIMAATGRRREAKRSYQKAIDLDPYFASARLDFARLLLQAGERDEGMQQIAEAAQIEPENPMPYSVLGDFYFEQGETGKAAAAFGHAIERDPNAVQALQRLASIMVADPGSRLYNERQAILLATKACELTRYRDPQVLITLSEVFAATGMQEDAVSSASAALRMAEASGETDLEREIRTKLERFKAL